MCFNHLLYFSGRGGENIPTFDIIIMNQHIWPLKKPNLFSGSAIFFTVNSNCLPLADVDRDVIEIPTCFSPPS